MTVALVVLVTVTELFGMFESLDTDDDDIIAEDGDTGLDKSNDT